MHLMSLHPKASPLDKAASRSVTDADHACCCWVRIHRSWLRSCRGSGTSGILCRRDSGPRGPQGFGGAACRAGNQALTCPLAFLAAGGRFPQHSANIN